MQPRTKRREKGDHMKREELKALGLTDEQINEVMKVNGTDIETVKAKATELEAQLTTINTTVKERDAQLATLQKASGDAESLKAQITALQEANTAQATESATKLKDYQINNAIKLALTGKAHDSDLVSGLLNKDKLVVNDDGTIIGLDDQVKTLKESKSFLFVADTPPAVPPGTEAPAQVGFLKIGNPPPVAGASTDSAISAAFGNFKK